VGRCHTLILMLLALPMAGAAQGTSSMSAAARQYIDLAIDSMAANAMRRDAVDWKAIREATYARAAGAKRPADTWSAIEWMLGTVDKHSFLQRPFPPSRGVQARQLDGRIGYLSVPGRGGPAVALADSLQDGLRALDTAGTCGWIVDLRGNPGGNVWPMYAGIGPLLGDSIISDGGARYVDGVSYLVEPGSAPQPVTRITVSPVTLRNPFAPVAVLTDEFTGSSGEAVAIAFKGRPATRFFGVRSSGYTTGNRGIAMPDGANLVVTVSTMRDRTGRAYPDGVDPDVDVEPGALGEDPVAARASAWLGSQSACQGR
jgi:carboxyl-terminal processing protease